MSDLELLLDTADLALARSEGVLPGDVRSQLGSVVRLARRRLVFLGEVLVVAFAGGTGSGKSSLVNALVREPVATTSVSRPTTGDALGVVPRGTEATYRGLLADLGVMRSAGVARLKRSILVDLPDFDSVEAGHRHIVEEVLPRVDAVVWVFDPEKYADSILHHDFLSPLTPYADQFVFVLNQVDRLEGHVQEVVEDLARLLNEDGFESAIVVSTVALQPNSDIDSLQSILIDRLTLKYTEIRKLATDLAIVATTGWREAEALFDGVTDDVVVSDSAALTSSTFILLGIHAHEVLINQKKVES